MIHISHVFGEATLFSSAFQICLNTYRFRIDPDSVIVKYDKGALIYCFSEQNQYYLNLGFNTPCNRLQDAEMEHFTCFWRNQDQC